MNAIRALVRWLAMLGIVVLLGCVLCGPPMIAINVYKTAETPSFLIWFIMLGEAIAIWFYRSQLEEKKEELQDTQKYLETLKKENTRFKNLESIALRERNFFINTVYIRNLDREILREYEEHSHRIRGNNKETVREQN